MHRDRHDRSLQSSRKKNGGPLKRKQIKSRLKLRNVSDGRGRTKKWGEGKLLMLKQNLPD